MVAVRWTAKAESETVRCCRAEEDAQSNETLKSEIRHVLHENELLRAQLHLVRENAGLRIGSLLATIISWFEERDKPGNGSSKFLDYRHFLCTLLPRDIVPALIDRSPAVKSYFEGV